MFHKNIAAVESPLTSKYENSGVEELFQRLEIGKTLKAVQVGKEATYASYYLQWKIANIEEIGIEIFHSTGIEI